MTVHLMDDKNGFKTTLSPLTSEVRVVSYDDETGLFSCVYPGQRHTATVSASAFSPPPPIPKAARPKPKPGEVWVDDYGKIVLLAAQDTSDGLWLCVDAVNPTARWRAAEQFTRPATPAEAEPFRPILDALQRSLGESHDQ